MAKTNKNAGAATAQSPAGQAESEQGVETTSAAAPASEASAIPPSGDQAVGAEPAQDAVGTPPPDPVAGDGDEDHEPDPPGPPVRALVLYDNIYGKCGEVVEFPADEVDAIAAAGYIDPHPNAVASATTGED